MKITIKVEENKDNLSNNSEHNQSSQVTESSKNEEPQIEIRELSPIEKLILKKEISNTEINSLSPLKGIGRQQSREPVLPSTFNR